MSHATLNIGILAHVDAGKTSLTERLLFDAGAIDRLGSVDSGDTRTDSGRIERQRGITVRTAVAPLHVGPVQVNLIDTPGHTDFVAEVERALSVLDAAVLVLSAVEGVQAHTRALMHTLRQIRLPAVLFVNKIDRRGARPRQVLSDIRRLLSPHVLPLNRVREAGTVQARTLPLSLEEPATTRRAAEELAEHDQDLLERLVEDLPLPPATGLRAALAAQVADALLYPVVFGSAITGQGTRELAAALTELLEADTTEEHPGRPRGTVFSIERSPSGEKTAYLRLRSGRLAAREHATFTHTDGRTHRGRVTHLEVVGEAHGRGGPLTAGAIGRIRGLPELRVGDRIGPPETGRAPAAFARPSLESLVLPAVAGQEPRLHAALVALAEQDPLINVRTVPGRGVAVLLYGEVQKEVIAATLEEDFGVRAHFEPSSTVYTERPTGVGEAAEVIGQQPPDGFSATVGLRVEPAPEGSGTLFRREVELGALLPAFDRAVVESVHHTLEQGLYGWRVTDCVVTLTRSGIDPGSTARAFRCLTPMVLMRALHRAGTQVLAPVHSFELRVPSDTLNPVLARLSELGAQVHGSTLDSGVWTLTGRIDTNLVHTFHTALPALSRGEGLWLAREHGSRPVHGRPPRRERTDGDPLNRDAYMIHLGRSGPGGRS